MNDVYRRIFRPLGINLMFDWVCGRRCLIQKLPLTWKWEASEFHSGARRDAVQLTESFSIRIEDVGKSGVRNKNHITHPPTQQSPVALRWMCVGSRRERDSLYCLVFHSHLISNFFSAASRVHENTRSCHPLTADSTTTPPPQQNVR